MKSIPEREYWHGSWVAIVTPFKAGAVDSAALARLVDWHCAAGTRGIVVCGSTGEAATLTEEEYRLVVRTVVEASRQRLPVVAGTGTNATASTIARTRLAAELGADAALVVTPYYNKPTPEGQYLHFKAVAEQGGLPVILYNVPGRTGTNTTPETVARLAELPQVVAIKEASGNVGQAAALHARCGQRLVLLSGEDNLTMPLMAQGAAGVISVTANVLPERVAAMVGAGLSGRWDEARRLHLELLPLSEALFFESNPIPVKTALGALGRIDPELRLPLCAMAPANRDKLLAVLRRYDLLH